MSDKSLSVAQNILEFCRDYHDEAVTPMQLIKLVYIAHGYMLGRHGEPLLDEGVQAWRYGPVIRSVYDAVRDYRSSPVDVVRGHQRWKEGFYDDEWDVMEEVAKEYGSYDGIVLSSATHKPGTPWSVTWQRNGQNSVISNDLIEHFYSSILNKPTHSSL